MVENCPVRQGSGQVSSPSGDTYTVGSHTRRIRSVCRKVLSSGAHWRFSGAMGPLSLSAGYLLRSSDLLFLVSGPCLNPYPEATHPDNCYLSLPGLGSRGSSRAGVALIIACALEGLLCLGLAFQKGPHSGGYSLIPVTAPTKVSWAVTWGQDLSLTMVGHLPSGAQPKDAWLLIRPCWRKRGQLWPQGNEWLVAKTGTPGDTGMRTT